MEETKFFGKLSFRTKPRRAETVAFPRRDVARVLPRFVAAVYSYKG
jgi:hypothetical protein